MSSLRFPILIAATLALPCYSEFWNRQASTGMNGFLTDRCYANAHLPHQFQPSLPPTAWSSSPTTTPTIGQACAAPPGCWSIRATWRKALPGGSSTIFRQAFGKLRKGRMVSGAIVRTKGVTAAYAVAAHLHPQAHTSVVEGHQEKARAY
jgi:hypothetical protein